MSGVDSNAFSSFPVCVILGLVLLLVAGGMLVGKRVVRMSIPGWFSLLVGCYFLVRCLNSYSVVDSWCEAVLIIGAFVYYVAGVYVAQNESYKSIRLVLAVALLLNMLVFWAAGQPWFELAWTGRAANTPAGANSVPLTLFVYKNFAGVFLCVAGCALGTWSLQRCSGVSRWCLLLISALGVLLSFVCGTRAVYLVLPVCLVGAWVCLLVTRMAENRKLGAGIIAGGFVAMVAGGVALYDLLFGHVLVGVFSGVDSHLRYLIWASVCEVLPSASLWGYGANAAQWEIVPFYNEWQLPNYAHNEYLQLWSDYGIIGLLCAIAVLVIHIVQGFCCMASEEVNKKRRTCAFVAMLILMPVALYALVDFPWHSFALLSMCAFACGILASPFSHRRSSWFSGRRWAVSSCAPMVSVRAESRLGKVVLLFAILALLVGSCWFANKLFPAWHAQWEYAALCKPGVDPQGNQRRDVIAGLMPAYPSPALADTYFMLPPYNPDPAEREMLLKRAMAANPKQLFTAVMLVDVLGEQGKCREAEMIMRAVYAGDSMKNSCLSSWSSYYALNLLRWGRVEMQQGNYAVALSMFDYALKIHSVSRISFALPWRSGNQPWEEHGGIKPWLPKYIATAAQDLRMLRLLGVQPDDSWMQPLTPGGRPALYQSLVKAAR